MDSLMKTNIYLLPWIYCKLGRATHSGIPETVARQCYANGVILGLYSEPTTNQLTDLVKALLHTNISISSPLDHAVHELCSAGKVPNVRTRITHAAEVLSSSVAVGM